MYKKQLTLSLYSNYLLVEPVLYLVLAKFNNKYQYWSTIKPTNFVSKNSQKQCTSI